MNFIIRKNLTSKIILVILALIFLFPNITVAQDTSGGQTQQPATSEAQAQQGDQASLKAKTDADSAKESGNNWLGTLVMGFINPLVNQIILIVTAIPQAIAALLMGLSGIFLQWVISYTVIGMSGAIKGMGAIDVAWVAFRDLANIFFIFILLFTAIQTILNVGGVNTKKTIVNVVITAIFLNFSLFFTKIIIDASNIIAIGLYKSTIGTHNVAGLGGILLDKMNVLDFYSVGTKLLQFPGNTLVTQLGSTVFMFIAACILFAVSLFFIIRFIVLIFLMILSPVAFAAMALPKDGYSSKWWDTLISQCLFAPVFMAMMWITVKIVGGVLPKKDTGASFATLLNEDIATQAAQVLPLFFNFIVIIVMLIFSLVVAKSLASKGAGSMMKMASWVQGKAGRGLVRASGIAQLDRKFADTQFGKSLIGRNLRSITTGAATSYDFGSGKSVQKVDKEVKKLNEDYGKKVREDTEKDHLKKFREDQLNGVMGADGKRTGGLKAEEKELEEFLKNTPALKEAEEKLRTETAAGNLFSEKEMDARREELEDLKRSSHPLDGGKNAAKEKELEEKIKKSEEAHTKIKGYRDNVEKARDRLEGEKDKKSGERKGGLKNQIKGIETRMEDKSGAETDDEKESLRTALRAKAQEMDDGGKGIGGIFTGTGKGLYKRAFGKINIPLITPYIQNALSTGAAEEAVKALRKSKGKGFKDIKDALKNTGVDVDEGGGDEEGGGGDKGGGGGK